MVLDLVTHCGHVYITLNLLTAQERRAAQRLGYSLVWEVFASNHQVRTAPFDNKAQDLIPKSQHLATNRE